MSALDKHTQVFDPATGKWTTKDEYKRKRVPWQIVQLLCVPLQPTPELLYINALIGPW